MRKWFPRTCDERKQTDLFSVVVFDAVVVVVVDACSPHLILTVLWLVMKQQANKKHWNIYQFHAFRRANCCLDTRVFTSAMFWFFFHRSHTHRTAQRQLLKSTKNFHNSISHIIYIFKRINTKELKWKFRIKTKQRFFIYMIHSFNASSLCGQQTDNHAHTHNVYANAQLWVNLIPWSHFSLQPNFFRNISEMIKMHLRFVNTQIKE